MLFGDFYSLYLELFRVQKGPRVVRVHNIHVTESYLCFSATCASRGNGGDIQVAMFYGDQTVRVYRLVDDQLEELTRIRLEKPFRLLWVAARLLVGAREPGGVIELEMRGNQLERCGELISDTSDISVYSWCPLDDGLAMFNKVSNMLLLYSSSND